MDSLFHTSILKPTCIDLFGSQEILGYFTALDAEQENRFSHLASIPPLHVAGFHRRIVNPGATFLRPR